MDTNSFNIRGYSECMDISDTNPIKQLLATYGELQDKIIKGGELQGNVDISFDSKVWFKNIHCISQHMRKLACDKNILKCVKKVLGPNVLLWGSSINLKKPMESHRWHIDVEHLEWPGVSVFVGMQGTSDQSTLDVLVGSHKFNNKNISFKTKFTNNDILNLASSITTNPKIEKLPIKDNGFSLFSGELWHGSLNETNNNRYAVILQYTTPNNKIKIPVTWDKPILWAKYDPINILVSGKDLFNVNTYL